MADNEKALPKREGPRRGGMLTGAVLGVLGTLAMVGALSAWVEHRPKAIHGEIVGADVTHHGGATIAIKNTLGSLTQTCHGGCDDLVFEGDSAENVYKAEVRDAAGRCVLCDGGDYVTGGMQVRWRLAGRDKLTLQKSSKFTY